MIACFGDSITAGHPGVSYIKHMQQNKICQNFGLGGDTLTGMSKRIISFLKASTCNEFIIEIGTNDILLPFLSTYSRAWSKTVKRIISRGGIPLENAQSFEYEYKKLLNRLLSSGKTMKLINIPCISEDPQCELNNQVWFNTLK